MSRLATRASLEACAARSEQRRRRSSFFEEFSPRSARLREAAYELMFSRT